MVQEPHKNVIPMTQDASFFKKLADSKLKHRDYHKAAEHYRKVLELSPSDFEALKDYTTALTEIGQGKQVIDHYFDFIAKDAHTADAFYQLSQLFIQLNDPNKAFCFGINYVIISNDEAYRKELEEMFEVVYDDLDKLEQESKVFAVQLIFQHLFARGRLEDARDYITNQDMDVQTHHGTRNLLAMIYLYLDNYDSAREMLKQLLKENQTDVHALCHYTLLLYNTKDEAYPTYLESLSKVVPMNDDESFKLGIVLSYLKKYQASQKLLYPLYRKGKFISLQLFHALSYNFYFLGNQERSHEFWKKLEDITQGNPGYPPWLMSEKNGYFKTNILPLLMSEDNHERLYGIFLLDQVNEKELLITEEIWSVLEGMGEYEKLYLTYLIKDLKLIKLGFIHRGMLALYENEELKFLKPLFLNWIDRAEGIIEHGYDLDHVEGYTAALVYLYFKSLERPYTKKQVAEWFGVTLYRLNKSINILLEV
ncbi:tetratricopeptide repeat protein [Staphylococcus simulans]|uniref:tetratricopeptide repeat protein n=1 Tax=Staphylococcus simulans TaxID=1286 RepID=UPI003F7E6E44